VLAGREDLRRIADRDPSNGHERAVGKRGVDVHDAVDPHLDVAAQPGARADVVAQDGGRSDIGARIDARRVSTVLDQHRASVRLAVMDGAS
jgi:hypothetical protein